MSEKKVPLAFAYSWGLVPDSMIPNVMAEFKWHGVDDLVFGSVLITRVINEPRFWSVLHRHAVNQGVNLIAVHAPWGQGYDLCCPEKGRRPGMIEDHKRAMNYCAESGCRTYTVHMGAYESVFYHTPNSELRPLVVNTLENLLPTAEKLGLVIALENSYERSHTPDEVIWYIQQFDSPFIKCCFDVGHAHLMAPFPGKKREKYFGEMDAAWGPVVEEYEGAYENLAPYIVTCHLHDNDGYSDAHRLPGEGTVDWKTLIPAIRRCPELISMQTEVIITPGLSIGKLVSAFRKIMGEE